MKLETINIQEVIDSIRSMIGKGGNLRESFGVPYGSNDAFDILTPEEFDSVMNNSNTEAERTADILEHIQEKAKTSSEAIFMFHMLTSFMADFNARKRLFMDKQN